jgi:hypothetical protein
MTLAGCQRNRSFMREIYCKTINDRNSIQGDGATCSFCIFPSLSLCFLFHETNSNYNFHTKTWWMRRRIYFIRKAKWGRQNWEEVSVNKYIIVTWWKEKKAEKSWIMWKYSTFTVWSNFCHFNMICDWSYSRGIETILSFNEYVSL